MMVNGAYIGSQHYLSLLDGPLPVCLRSPRLPRPRLSGAL